MKHRILLFCFLLFSAATTSFSQELIADGDSLSTDTLAPIHEPVIASELIEEVVTEPIQTHQQNENTRRIIKDRKPIHLKPSPTDSIAIAYAYKFNQLSKRFSNYRYTGSDTLANPYYFYIFTRPTYYNSPMHHIIGQLPEPQPDSSEYVMPPLLPKQNVVPKNLLDGICNALVHVYTQTPQYIANNEDAHLNESGIRKDFNKEVKPTIKLTEKVVEEAGRLEEELDVDDWKIVVHRPNFWNFKFNFSLNMMQYYVSKNWHKGGESHNSWVMGGIIDANYNNKQKVTFDNRLEMRLGFQSSKDDKEHKYLSNSDQIRLSNKLGLKASKHWYYTLMLQSWTQFYPRYKKNDKKVYSDFMSPFESVFSVGMDYKLNVKNFNISATMSPFAGNYKYVDRKALSTSFGVKKDRHSKFDFGSNITVNYTWNIMKNVSWRGRIFYFTDYDMAKVEWENTFNLKINNFLTTQLFIYPRFDDSVKKKGDNKSYFQFNETLSLGFNYTF